eukprot:CAMPEP_0116130596 /NCGR_PEP_ID=MMETSP0329-20121206/8566_1 /TAXON_ID=697910 /ORGANISM="Pseudo-nitzschia arenysensis, Strain B593" /LENGTH=592 /DNA_ID=CAMNT_0003624989 /DNA_START=66 /DNA_END=1844 /DNA_ORIENTATION=+
MNKKVLDTNTNIKNNTNNIKNNNNNIKNNNNNNNNNMTTKTNTNTNQGPTNPLVRALLTDLYQLTMTYAHWKTGKANDHAVFELFFRKNPFKGGYTVFCGLDECIKLLQTFSFTEDDIAYLKSTDALSHCEQGFFDYLATIEKQMASTKVYAAEEGAVVFPRCPLITVEGPLGVGQLLETTLLNLVNYPSLIATNASRMVLRAQGIPCIEFGLRRAQGPDGACTASKYSYVGGFVGTSNVQAGKSFGIPIAGTHAHSYVQSFSSLDEASGLTLFNKKSKSNEHFLEVVLKYRTTSFETNDGELAAFCNYACAFPNACLCLIDTYNTLESGLQNFIAVAKALDDFGYEPKGVRLDSGDLVTLSNGCKQGFDAVIKDEPDRTKAFGKLTIVASNDINEAVLEEFSTTKHSLTAFGIGTNLVTCQAQPALGCVYKLVELKGEPRIKLSEEVAKVTLPGRKQIYRLYGGPKGNTPLVDYMTQADEPPPTCSGKEGSENKGILCRDPFRNQHRLKVYPTKVKALQKLVFDGGEVLVPTTIGYLSHARDSLKNQLSIEFSEDVTSSYPSVKYDVMVSPLAYTYLHELWEKNAPIPDRR